MLRHTSVIEEFSHLLDYAIGTFSQTRQSVLTAVQIHNIMYIQVITDIVQVKYFYYVHKTLFLQMIIR
jgi:hypothetical protein